MMSVMKGKFWVFFSVMIEKKWRKKSRRIGRKAKTKWPQMRKQKISISKLNWKIEDRNCTKAYSWTCIESLK